MAAEARRERDVAQQGLRDMAQALGLDSSLPTDELIKQAQGVKVTLEKTKKAADWSHLMEEDKLKDCVIQVKIPHEVEVPPPSKRTRTSGKAQSTPFSIKTVRAHSLILSSRSEYFKAALVRGQWAESQDKTIDIDLPSVEEFEALKLLMELSYGLSYIQRPSNDARLGRDTLLQLIVVANMFEFTACVDECCEEVKRIITPDNAMDLIASLYHMEDAHDSISQLLDDAVGKLGPLEKLLAAAPTHKIQAIVSDDMLTCILKSDKLVVNSENTTFTLVHWWLSRQEGWTVKQKQESFNKIHASGVLRYHCMDLTYLAAYALRSPWVADGHRFPILQQVIFSRNKSEKARQIYPVSRTSAMVTPDTTFQYECSLLGRDCQNFDVHDETLCFLGVVHGFPTLARIRKKPGPDGKPPTFGIYGGWHGESILLQPEAEMRIPAARIDMKLEVTPDFKNKGKATIVSSKVADETFLWGKPDFFDAPWEEVMAEGSPYFDAGGVMKMKFTVDMKINL